MLSLLFHTDSSCHFRALLTGFRGNPNTGLKDVDLGVRVRKGWAKGGASCKQADWLFPSSDLFCSAGTILLHKQRRNVPCRGRLWALSPGCGEGTDYLDTFRSHFPPLPSWLIYIILKS